MAFINFMMFIYIGVARVLRLGGNVKPVSTYPMSKTKNSSDLVHYFFAGLKFTFENKIQINNKDVMLGRTNARLTDPKGPRSYVRQVSVVFVFVCSVE